METTFDVIVIGGGPAGENAADYVVRGSGLTCALIEHELVGGECSYWACMPSKALLRPLDVAATAAHLDGLAGTRLDSAGLLRRRDAWRSHLDDAGQVEWAESQGITVLRGHGRLAGERRVELSSGDGVRSLTARRAVVMATGSVPAIPKAWRAAAPWTTRDATGVQEAPARLAVVGGGVAACEAATWLAALGSEVTMLVRGSRLLDRTEAFAADAVADALRAAGVTLRFETSVAGVERTVVHDDPETGRPHGGPVRLDLGDGSLEVDEVLAATGRRPATDGLGLDTVGLEPDDLDGSTELREGWLYAVGDVTGGPKLTHWGKHQARRVGELIAARAAGRPDPEVPGDVPVPQVVFTDPQVAQVGPTADDARAADPDVWVVDEDLTGAAGVGLLRDDAAGKARLVLSGDRIVGATFVGPEVAELLHAATVAIVGRVPLATLRQAVPAYPTASEIWLRLVEAAWEQHH